MHQTFYIEADEEISSAIEKLHKSLATENYFVVTKRTLVAQSIVNLKLLKREADKIKKNIIIVTADEQIMRMAERAGISAQASMDGLDFVEEERVEVVETEEVPETEIKLEPDFTKRKKKRLIKVGSSDYHSSIPQQAVVETAEETEEEIAIDEEPEMEVLEQIVPKKPVRRMDDFKKNIDSGERAVSDGIRKIPVRKTEKPVRRTEQKDFDLKESFEAFLDPDKEKKFEKIFSSPMPEVAPVGNKYESRKEDGGGKNLMFTFILIALVAFAGVAAYVLVPKAEVVAYLDAEDKTINLTITADANLQAVDVENLKIPGRMVEKEGEITLSNEATGASESSGQKAKGTLVIYNEYSKSDQPLIATTRFETKDGKIFRLVKGVSVPGMSSVGGETEPGAIEVEVVADMPGEAYNIEPDSFVIPGLKGTDKYDKIYAKSAKAMIGGGLSGDTVKIVSQGDIDSAKKKTEDAINEKIVNIVKGELGEGEILLSQGLKMDIFDSIPYAKSGDLKDSFDYQIRAKMTALVVSKKDIEEMISRSYQADNKKAYKYAIDEANFEFESVKSDFENKKADLVVVAQVSATPIFDSAGFKRQILAKDESRIREVMKNYPQVKSLEISVEPVFLSNTPRFESRINLEVRDFEAE